jgi:hypothetical protein
MKTCPALMSLVVAILFLPAISLAQEQGTPAERKPIDSFYADADYHSKTLLLKVLQFRAPYPGYYEQTSVDTNGVAFTARIVPNWAVQASVHAKLDEARLAQIRQMLGELLLTASVVEPQPGQLHSAFVFSDGHDFLRFDYNGPNPAQIEAILTILHQEFMAAARAQREELAAHNKRMRETYGDWENRAGITRNAGGVMNVCKGSSAVVVLTAGQRKTFTSSSPLAVSVYHALVFYPSAPLAGAGSGGRWSDDPVQSYVLIWRLPNVDGSFSAESPERKFEILHNAIDATVTIGGKIFQLSNGNMFVVRLGADWLPTVTQLREVFEEQTTPQASLDRFKALLKDDASVQKLEL